VPKGGILPAPGQHRTQVEEPHQPRRGAHLQSTKDASAVSEELQYSVERVLFDELTDQTLARWKALRQKYQTTSHRTNPDWMRGYFQGLTDNLFAYLLYRGDSLCGVALFLRLKWPLQCHLGDFQVGSFPMMRFRLIGGEPDFPSENGAYDALFATLREAVGFDTLFLDGVPVDSFLWQYIERSAVVRNAFRRYIPEPVAPHPLIRFKGTFEVYMKNFSTRHRYNLRRRVTKFAEDSPEPVTWVRYTKPEEVSVFLEHAIAISKKTYQWNTFGRGLSDTPRIKNRLVFAAEHGWFRSYILFRGERPCAFVAGFQIDGCYEHHEIGYDPEWRKFAVGTVLHMYMIQDLFVHDPPDVLDFGDYGQYKEELSNESILRGKVFLYGKRRLYVDVAKFAHAGCRKSSRIISSSLERLGLKAKIKKLIRGFGASQ
jgi:hypothetical protein